MANKKETTVVQEPKYDCNEKIDGTKVWYYFNPPKIEEGDEIIKDGKEKIKNGIIFIIVAIVLFILLIKKIKTVFFISLIAIALGVVAILRGKNKIKKGEEKKEELRKKIVTDQEYDRMEQIMLNDVVQKGMDNLNLDEDEIKEADPLVLHRYDNGGVAKRGEDGRDRCSEIVSTVFYFTSDTLFVYSYRFSMICKVFVEESTTLFYTDIVSTKIKKFEAQSGQSDALRVSTVEISTVGGQIFTYQFIDSPGINKSLNAMQSFFRSKKKG